MHKSSKLLKLLAFVICLFLIIPIFIIIPMSFGSSNYLEFPPRGFSTRWYESFLQDRKWMESLFYSLEIGIGSTILSLFLGVLASEGLTRVEFKGKRILQQIYQLPMIVPVIVISIALFKFESQLGLRGSTIGLILAHTLMGLPYVVSAVYSRRVSVDPNMSYASMNLGASPAYTMVHVILPIIQPALFSGALFAFATSFDELVISMFLCSIRNTTLPKKMWDGMRSEIDPTISAIASILVIIVSIIMITSSVSQYRKENMKPVKEEE